MAAIVVMVSLSAQTAAAMSKTVPPPSKTDICKSMGTLGGNIPSSNGKTFIDCGEVLTVANGTPTTENTSCPAWNTKHKPLWGYWLHSSKIQVHLVSISKKGALSVAFVNKTGKSQKVRVWLYCAY
jgi:hypothetical protein